MGRALGPLARAMAGPVPALAGDHATRARGDRSASPGTARSDPTPRRGGLHRGRGLRGAGPERSEPARPDPPGELPRAQGDRAALPVVEAMSRALPEDIDCIVAV